ncbi:MAG: PRD domain-containing protein [Clostridium sp.]|uniref:PRD domain-containing protein n=1 Tax=Clostridium sp. TaxID=1506 RepID=UPI00290CD83A|nr:PRD domain-containing protein [Clostridium sp.]MDU5110216.1 PRD domain-containing protein [Clostridium sp.]
MKILKKLNNNVVLALNDKGEEIIVTGKGLGFRKMPYILEDISLIEKKYIIPQNTKASEILESIPNEVIKVTEKVIRSGYKELNMEFNADILLTLSDHINFAIQRSKEGVEMRSPLQWEIKHLYPKEYEIGFHSLDIIENDLGVKLDKNEAAFIALHFINAQIGKHDMTETTKITTIMGEILSLIKYKFKIEFNEDSFEFTRFVTHIKYFIIRQVNNKPLDNDNNDMFDLMKEKLTEELECVEIIEKHLNKNYGWKCTNDEKLYLMLHIQRIRKEKN